MINYIVSEETINKINDMVWRGFDCENRCAPYELLTEHPVPEYDLCDLILGMQKSIKCDNQLDILCTEAGWVRSLVIWWKKNPCEAIAISKQKGWLK